MSHLRDRQSLLRHPISDAVPETGMQLSTSGHDCSFTRALANHAASRSSEGLKIEAIDPTVMNP